MNETGIWGFKISDESINMINSLVSDFKNNNGNGID